MSLNTFILQCASYHQKATPFRQQELRSVKVSWQLVFAFPVRQREEMRLIGWKAPKYRKRGETRHNVHILSCSRAVVFSLARAPLTSCQGDNSHKFRFHDPCKGRHSSAAGNSDRTSGKWWSASPLGLHAKPSAAKCFRDERKKPKVFFCGFKLSCGCF